MKIDGQLDFFLENLKKNNLYRKRNESRNHFDILFCSNDYLSLSNEPIIKEGYLEGVKDYPIGSGGSMVVSGHHQVHQKLEQQFSDFLEVDDSILFNSGYVANLSIMRLLKKLELHLIIDKAIHASVYDGISAQDLSFTRYAHQNTTQMMRKIKQVQKDKVLMTEGIFSMSGHVASLKVMAEFCQTLNMPIIVDEAHSFGVLGCEGRGAVHVAGLTQKEVPLRVIPLGKAMASTGAIVAGQKKWIDALIQCSRPYIYSTGLSAAHAFGLRHTLKQLIQADEKRDNLYNNIQYFRQQIKYSKWQWKNSHSPIQFLETGCSKTALNMSEVLKNARISCIAMRPPTLPPKETGLRVTLNASHQPAMIDKFFSVVEKL